MNHLKSITRKSNLFYALSQGTYWMLSATIGGFAALFLSSRGLSDTQSGVVFALAALGCVLLQIFVSDFSDRHTKIPLKRIIAVFYIIAVVSFACLMWIPSSVAFVMIVFVCGYSFITALNGFLNALIMQLHNIGLPINFGIPRGIGSVSYAVLAFILGIIIENSSVELVLPVSICVGLLAILCVLCVPRPDHIMQQYSLHPPSAQDTRQVSLVSMLKSNKTLVFLMIATTLTFTGQSVFYTFLIRAVENVGGNTANLGTCYLINSGFELPTLFLASVLLKRFSSRGILTVSFLAFFIRSLVLALAPSIGFVYLSCALSIGGLGLFGFASVYFVNEIVPVSEQVRGQSMVALCGLSGISSIIGSLLGGVIIDHLGVPALLFIYAGFSLLGFFTMLYVGGLHRKSLSPAS